MDDRIEPLELRGGHVPQVHLNPRRILRGGTEHAVGEEAGVQPCYLVSRSLQYRHHHCAEVTLMSGYQDA